MQGSTNRSIRQNKTSSYGLNHGWLWFILDFVWRLDVQLREFSSYIRNILRGGGGNGTWHRGNTDAADGGHSTNIGEETQDKAKIDFDYESYRMTKKYDSDQGIMSHLSVYEIADTIIFFWTSLSGPENAPKPIKVHFWVNARFGPENQCPEKCYRVSNFSGGFW